MNIPFSTLHTLCKRLDMPPFPYIYTSLATFDQGVWQTQIASERYAKFCKVGKRVASAREFSYISQINN